MNTLGKRLKAARSEAGMSRQDLVRVSGVGYSTIAEIENDGMKSTTKIPELAAAVDVADKWLSSGVGQRERSNVSPGPDIKGRVPLVSWVQAGDFTEVHDEHHVGDAFEWIPTTAAIHEHTFALRVKGDSMMPRFPPSTILIVEPDIEPHPGDYVISKNGGGEATFKRLRQDGGELFLEPINPQWSVKPLGDARIIGVVVKVEWDPRDDVL